MHLLIKPEHSKSTGDESASIDYNRSLSSPATVLALADISETTLPKRATTDCIVKCKDSATREKAKISDPILPTSFDFSSGGQSSKGREVEDEEPVKSKSRGDDDMFVFTASIDTKSDESLAVLTQQLELGSDSVSRLNPSFQNMTLELM